MRTLFQTGERPRIAFFALERADARETFGRLPSRGTIAQNAPIYRMTFSPAPARDALQQFVAASRKTMLRARRQALRNAAATALAARAMGNRARKWARGLSSSRLPFAGGPRRDDTGSIAWPLLLGAGLGAGAMYFLDYSSGRRRRGLMRDKLVHAGTLGRDAVDTGMRDLRHRAGGVAARLRPGAWRNDHPDDDVLLARVRTCLGRAVSHPHAIEVKVRDGRVTLTGAVLPEEVRSLVRAVSHVRGVDAVDERLAVHGYPERVPSLQGGVRRGRTRREWRPATRLVATTLGGTACVGAILRGGIAGGLGGLAGALVCARAVGNRPLRELAGLGRNRRLFEFRKSIEVNAPVEKCFSYWADFGNFPSIFSHVQSVSVGEGGRSHWVVQGPAGLPVSWDAEITRYEPGRVLAWKSLPGSLVAHAGVIQFEATGEGTRMDIRLSYNPPAGVLGHGVARMLGSDPKRALDEDLLRFKSLMEIGKTTAHGETAIAVESSPPMLH